MKIFIGADHRGFILKKKFITTLTQKGHDVVDMGSFIEGEACDYPLISYKVAKAVAKSRDAKGILVCMTGIGHSIAANKVRGIRAALCYNKKAAHLSRAHNDSNILIVGSQFVTQKNILGIVTTWLKSEFEGGRHLRRVNQIKQIEKKICQD